MNIQDEAYSEAMDEIKRLKALLTRAADALEKVASYVSGDSDAYRYLRLEEQRLIQELRKAAQ
jgi:hypothetical protein